MSVRVGARRSVVTGQAWPALPSAHGAMLGALLYQFERSQWLSAAELLTQQFLQLKQLLRHAHKTVPFYRDRLRDFDFSRQLTVGEWREIPVISRRTVQRAGRALHSSAVPREFGAISTSETSGSTGEPVRLLSSGLDLLMWQALTMREHYWHARDFAGKLAAIRVFANAVGAAPDGSNVQNWGVPASELHVTGPMALLNLSTDIAVQARWLRHQNPKYLLTYPTNLRALLSHARQHGWSLAQLTEVRTVGETVTAELRAEVRDTWGVQLTDVYSSRELGYIALQCPTTDNYHVCAETMLVEVLDEDGQPARVGDVGRVVVTPLHNYASPLIRYAINDYAEVGPPCACGRGLPTIRKILGRTRNMVFLPDGQRYWPQLGFGEYRKVAPVTQYQLVQLSVRDIEVRLVVERDLSPAEETLLSGVIQRALGYPFNLHFKYFEGLIPRGAGGKFEEFIGLGDA